MLGSERNARYRDCWAGLSQHAVSSMLWALAPDPLSITVWRCSPRERSGRVLRKRTQGTPPRVVGRACGNPQHKAAAVDGVRAVAEGTGAERAAT